MNAYTILRYLLLLGWKKSQSLHLLYFPFSVFHSVSIASISLAMQEFGFMDADGIFSETCGLPLLFEKSGASLILWALVYFMVHFQSVSRMVTGIGSGACFGHLFCLFQCKWERTRLLDMLIRTSWTRHSSHSRMWSRLSSCFWVTKWFVPCWTRRKVPRPGPQNCEVDFQLRSSASLGQKWNAKWCCCLGSMSQSVVRCCHVGGPSL